MNRTCALRWVWETLSLVYKESALEDLKSLAQTLHSLWTSASPAVSQCAP